MSVRKRDEDTAVVEPGEKGPRELPEVVAIPKETYMILKEVDADTDTWIGAESTCNLKEMR